MVLETPEIGGQRLATFPWFDVVHDVRDSWIANYDSDSLWSKQHKKDLLKFLQTKEEPTIDLHEWEQILNKDKGEEQSSPYCNRK